MNIRQWFCIPLLPLGLAVAAPTAWAQTAAAPWRDAGVTRIRSGIPVRATGLLARIHPILPPAL